MYEELPPVLAGPVLRRVEPDSVVVWLATSERLSVRGEVWLSNPAREASPDDLRSHSFSPLGTGSAHTVKLGDSLYVHLVTIRPDGDGPLPTGILLRYSLSLEATGDGEGETIADPAAGLGLSGDFSWPTFVIQDPRQDLRALYASCRKLHGEGTDAAPAALELLRRAAWDSDRRPQVLLLTGDQIYADDVSDLLIRDLATLGERLTGHLERIPNLTGIGVGDVRGRAEPVTRDAGLTSGEAENHLVRFGEYAALYLLSWNPDLWRGFPSLGDVMASMDPDVHVQRETYLDEYRCQERALEDAREGSRALRRVLANVPTYMIFDDHEVTDDWNLNEEWEREVYGTSAGRRILANGLAAYWAFQGWGNRPSDFEEDLFIEPVEAHLGHRRGPEAAARFEETLLGHPHWWFRTPTRPSVVFLDTRTRRGISQASHDRHNGRSQRRAPYPSGGRSNRPPRLLEPELKAELFYYLIRNDVARETDPLLLVAPAPVIGATLIEALQRNISEILGPEAYDFEAWSSNPRSLVDVLELVTRLRRPVNVILSGDVHYAYVAEATVVANRSGDGRPGRLLQFTSSATKNRSMTETVAQLQSAGPFERWWWSRGRSGPMESWDIDDGHREEASRRAEDSGPPNFELEWEYVRNRRSHGNVLVAENNVGYLTIWGRQSGRNQLFTMENGDLSLLSQYEWRA